jgi:hypothetical protein
MSTANGRAAIRRNGLTVDITDEDLAYARQENRYSCAIVCAIQRKLKDALYVRADTSEIAFSLPDDGPTGTRYYFSTPEDVITKIIKPFDLGLDLEERTFTLIAANRAEPMKRSNRAERIEIRGRKRRAPRTRSTSGNVHSAKRFRDYQAEESTA